MNGQVYENVAAQRRYYDSIEDSVGDHELFLQAPRYAAVRSVPAPVAQCQALYASGYATDAPARRFRRLWQRGLLTLPKAVRWIFIGF